MIATKASLNEHQRMVSENMDEHILLLAGAGTGKTGTLAARVAFLMNQGVSEKGILCLTFTNRACREMLERVTSVAGDVAQGVTVRTFHSFCAYLLRELPKKDQVVDPKFSVCDEEDALETIRAVVLEVTGKEIDSRSAGILQRFIGLVKETQLLTKNDDCRRAATMLFNQNREALEKICINSDYSFDGAFFRFLGKYGASLAELYNHKLRESNLLDFNDLPIMADRAMDAPTVEALWGARFQYVHVDEAQDMSMAEYHFLLRFCRCAKVMLCGDFNQTIYQWRGSSPQELQEAFEQTFSPVRICFTQNYRSCGELIHLAENFLYHAFGQGEGSNLDPTQTTCTQVRMEAFSDIEQEAAWIYRQIQALNLKDLSRCAILTRNNQICKTFCDQLKLCCIEKDTPLRFMLSEELRLFRRPEVKDVLACLRLVLNPYDTESMRRLLFRWESGVGAATLRAVQKASSQVRLADFLHHRTTRTGDFFGPLLDALAAGQVVVFDVESTGTDVYTDDVIQIAAIRLDGEGKESARFQRFLIAAKPVGDSQKVHGFSDEYLASQGVPPRAALEDFLAFVEGCVVVGHNVRYDMTITGENMARQGMGHPLQNMWYDTLDLARRFLPKLENHKLATVAAFLEVHVPTHDAMDDILATAGVLNHLVKTFLAPGEEGRRQCYAGFSTKFSSVVEKLRRISNQPKETAGALIDHVFSEFPLPETASQEQWGNRLLLREFTTDFVDVSLALPRQIAALLELTALSASELERMGKSQNKVPIITVHQSKGCEFDYVFMPMLCDSIFPSYQSLRTKNDEEEKRVFYVSITRAKKCLYLSWSHRNENGRTFEKSRYLKLLEKRGS